jgi:O-acetylhomoserine (thiol)-lyase
VTLPRLGITTSFVIRLTFQFRKSGKRKYEGLFAESLGNPKLDVLDLKSISAEAKKLKVPFIVDNTVASPYLLNPIEHGATIVIHSLTKYIAGNGTSLEA